VGREGEGRGDGVSGEGDGGGGELGEVLFVGTAVEGVGV